MCHYGQLGNEAPFRKGVLESFQAIFLLLSLSNTADRNELWSLVSWSCCRTFFHSDGSWLSLSHVGAVYSDVLRR